MILQAIQGNIVRGTQEILMGSDSNDFFPNAFCQRSAYSAEVNEGSSPLGSHCR